MIRNVRALAASAVSSVRGRHGQTPMAAAGHSLARRSARCGCICNASARFFFKLLKRGPPLASDDPFSNLQSNPKQLNKVLQSENSAFNRFFSDNPEVSKLAEELRLEMLQGQDEVRQSFRDRLAYRALQSLLLRLTACRAGARVCPSAPR
jgi:hypothetical protein